MYKSIGPEYVIDGRTLEVFPFWPNYTRAYIERWEFKTSVLTAFDGSEQRAWLRKNPRQSFEYEVFAQGSDKAALNHFLQAGAHTIYGVPLWNWGDILQGDTLQDSNLYLPISARGFRVGGYLVGFLDPTIYELRQITAIDANGVQLDGVVTWPPGTWVKPVIPALLNNELTISHTTGGLATPVVSFNGLPAVSSFNTGTPTYPPYLGHYVLEEVFDRSQPANFTYHYKTATLDNMFSAPFVDVESATPAIVQPKQWFLSDQDKIVQFLFFIHYCVGQLRPFWVWSGTQDMEATALSGVNLIATDTAYTRLVPHKAHRQHLRIATMSGTYYRKILSSTPNVDTEVFELDVALPCALEDILGISFMSLARLDSDRIELAYTHAGFAKAETLIRTLQHEL